jgi:hypothetical protein
LPLKALSASTVAPAASMTGLMFSAWRLFMWVVEMSTSAPSGPWCATMSPPITRSPL